MVSGRGVGLEKGTVFSKGLATGSLTMFQGVYGRHKLELFYFASLCSVLSFLFPPCLWRIHKGGGGSGKPGK